MSVPSPLAPAAVLQLTELGVIRATGADAQAFLQSQLSNDAKQLTTTQGQLSGYCSVKGRLLAVLTVLQLAEQDYALVLPVELIASTLKRLNMFVMRSKLKLSEASDSLSALGVMGAEAHTALARVGIAAPTEDYGVSAFEGGWLLKQPGALPRYQLHATPEQLTALRHSLTLPEASVQHWALAEIEAGTPQVRAETADQFLPQSINLDIAGGVSFSKGCYPGQEIVARVHYLGRVKQRLHLAQCASAASPGDAVYVAGGSGRRIITTTHLKQQQQEAASSIIIFMNPFLVVLLPSAGVRPRRIKIKTTAAA